MRKTTQETWATPSFVSEPASKRPWLSISEGSLRYCCPRWPWCPVPWTYPIKPDCNPHKPPGRQLWNASKVTDHHICLIGNIPGRFSMAISRAARKQSWVEAVTGGEGLKSTDIEGPGSPMYSCVLHRLIHIFILKSNFRWLILGTELDSLEVGPKNLQFRQPTRWFLCTLNLKTTDRD